MNIIKVLEHITKHSGPWNDKEILKAMERTKIHKESRERIAVTILQAKLTTSSTNPDTTLVKLSVKLADALIEELNK